MNEIYNIILIFFTLITYDCSSYFKKDKQEWVDAFLCVNKRHLKKIEQKFGLVAEGTGWTKQEGLRVPSYGFICYQKMNPEEAYELYFKVTSFLQKIVSEHLAKKGFFVGREYKKIPLDILVLFFTPKRDFQASPYVATVSVVKDSVVMRSISSPVEPLQTLIEYPLKEFEEKVFRASEETCESNPTSHQSRKKPMHYRRCSR